jgi:DNA-binding response OmpR family regulator
MTKTRVLVVDDDHKIVDLIRLYLEKDGYRVLAAYDGERALELVRDGQPELVVLDLMLPQVGGLDVCRAVRAQSNVPIIMLTARSTEEDKLVGLDLGADDYVTKPFSPRELLARVRAVLRRVNQRETESLPQVRVGNLEIDLLRHEVKVDQKAVYLTPKEFKVLETLAKEPGRAFSRRQLVERVFGPDYEGMDRSVDEHVMNLRKKIEDDPRSPYYVQTVYGLGYKLNEELNE